MGTRGTDVKHSDRLEIVPTKWTVPVLVCQECAKRTGPDNHPSALRRSLRKELGRQGLKHDVRVVEATCLDVCPKRGVTVVVGGGPGAVVVERPTQWSALAELVVDRVRG
jgi:predicted metal-binding protein